MMARQTLDRVSLLLILVVSFLCYLPFLDKGITNDDLVFLDYAKRLTLNPTVCVVDDYFFLGHVLKDLVVFESTHPPLVPYVIRACLFFFGDSLFMMHLCLWFFLALASVSLGDLFVRYTKGPPLLVLAVTLGPLLLPNATGLMTDVALFACWFAAMAAWERALDQERPGWWHVLTAGFACAAFFTAYQGLGLLVVLVLQACLRGRIKEALIWPLVALVPFILWVALVYRNYGILPYFSPPRAEVSIANEVSKGLVWQNMLDKARALCFYLGAGLVFFSPFLLWRRGRGWQFSAVIGWACALVLGLFGELDWGTLVFAVVLASCGLMSLVILGDSVLRLWREDWAEKRVELALLACIAGFFVFQVVLASFAAPRYNLIPLAALFLLLFRGRELPRMVPLFGALCLTVLLGLGVAYAEKEYADAQRIDLLDLPEGAFYAGEKGMVYAGDKAGLRYFLPDYSEEVGYLLVPEEIDHIPVPQRLLDQAVVEQTFEIESSLPIRVMKREAHAGFYIHTRGMLPFVFDTSPIDRLTLYRIEQYGHPWWREAGYEPKPAGNILPDAPVSQTFTCRLDGLFSFRILLATYNRSNTSTLVVSLLQLDEEGERVVFREEVSAEDLADNGWHRYSFEPQRSKGKRYKLELSSPNAEPANSVTIWTNTVAEGAWQRGDAVSKGALVFESFCSPGVR